MVPIDMMVLFSSSKHIAGFDISRITYNPNLGMAFSRTIINESVGFCSLHMGKYNAHLTLTALETHVGYKSPRKSVKRARKSVSEHISFLVKLHELKVPDTKVRRYTENSS